MRAISILFAGVIGLFLFLAVGEYIVGLYAQKHNKKSNPFGVGFGLKKDKRK